MKVYLKVHIKEDIETIACCDAELLNQVFKEGNLRIEISNRFFGGKLINLEEAILILENASSFNIVGEKIIKKAVEREIIQHYKTICGIPMALKMIF
ncbi:MAG: DUF424 family protein [Candidatus Lokiarchaeota archaeon]|nr:DUF424 family protein [Candidatus Lokiarchaeota archaeon]